MADEAPSIPLRAEYLVHDRDDWAYEAEDDADYDAGYPTPTGIRTLDVDDLVAQVKEWPDHGDIMISAERTAAIDTAGFKLYLLPEPARRLALALVRAADLLQAAPQSTRRDLEALAGDEAEKSQGVSAGRAAEDPEGSRS